MLKFDKKNEMRILHIVSGLQKASGVTTFVENVVAELRTLGHEVDVVTRITGAADVALVKSYDVVHVHGLWDPWLHRWALAARNAGVKMVWSPHGMLTPWALGIRKWKKRIAWLLYQKRALKNADLIHVTAPAEVDGIRHLGLINAVAVVPLGVRMGTRLVHPHEARRERTILFVGRHHRIKGLANLIDAWARLSDAECAGWHIVLAGPNQCGYADEVLARAAARGVAARVSYVGPVFDAEKDALYAAADVFILPSFSENFGSVVVEALAAGVPVIASKGTPWAELEEWKCGRWVENDPETLARTIQEMMSLSDAERAAMGERGRHLVEEKYQWPAIGRVLLAAYAQLQ